MSKKNFRQNNPDNQDINEVTNNSVNSENTVDSVEETANPVTVKTPVYARELTPMYGRVFNCEKLNVREMPSKESNVLKVINKGCKVKIDLSESSDEWVKVITSDVEGFCMREFIKMI